MGDVRLATDRVVTAVASVLTGERPVMIVEHWEVGDWVFRPAGSFYTTELVDVPFAELVRADPGLAELADLPGDWVASRHAVGEAWRRRWMYEDTRYIWDTPDAEPGAAPDVGA